MAGDSLRASAPAAAPTEGNPFEAPYFCPGCGWEGPFFETRQSEDCDTACPLCGEDALSDAAPATTTREG